MKKKPACSSPVYRSQLRCNPFRANWKSIVWTRKGSFTSAIRQRKGDFELAHGGTLFLDEIGDMSHSAQAKVLRALQENKITRVGGEKDIQVDVRILAATNKNLKEEIDNGNFREDLYHRLSVIIIEVPDLNKRDGDIPLLADHFMDDICKKMGKPILTFSKEAYKKTWRVPVDRQRPRVKKCGGEISYPLRQTSYRRRYWQIPSTAKIKRISIEGFVIKQPFISF